MERHTSFEGVDRLEQAKLAVPRLYDVTGRTTLGISTRAWSGAVWIKVNLMSAYLCLSIKVALDLNQCDGTITTTVTCTQWIAFDPSPSHENIASRVLSQSGTERDGFLLL